MCARACVHETFDITAMVCSSSPALEDGELYSIQHSDVATFNSTQFPRGTILSYRCSSEERFDDGTTDKKILCTSVGLWNESISLVVVSYLVGMKFDKYFIVTFFI